MTIEIDEGNLAQGLLGLLVTLVEIIKEALEGQSLKRMESGDLKEEEVERLGKALMDLDEALDSLKKQHNLEEVVRKVRRDLDGIVDETIGMLVNPKRWEEGLGMK